MRPLGVIKVEISIQARDGLMNSLVAVQVDFFVFDTPPESFDEDIVQGPAAAIHADGHLMIFENPGERIARELRALITIEDFRFRPKKSPIKGADAEIAVQCGRDLPTEYIARVPVDDRDQIDEPSHQADICDVSAPDLVYSVDFYTSQEVRVYLMPGSGHRQARLRIDRLKPHLPHQSSDPFGIDLMANFPEPSGHLRNAKKRVPGILFVDQAHQMQILRALRHRFVVITGAGQSDQFALPADADCPVPRVYQQSLMFSREFQTFF